jgi:hypothetical protein
MPLDNNLQNIANNWKTLNQLWKQVSGEWDDAVRLRFEREYWQPLSSQVPQFLESLKALASAIEKAKESVK